MKGFDTLPASAEDHSNIDVDGEQSLLDLPIHSFIPQKFVNHLRLLQMQSTTTTITSSNRRVRVNIPAFRRFQPGL